MLRSPPRCKTSLKPSQLNLFSPTPSYKPPPPPDPRGRRTYWAAPTAADLEKRSATDNDRETPAQIQHLNIQTNIEIQKFHVRDTTHFLQDDLGVQDQFHVDKIISVVAKIIPKNRGTQTPELRIDSRLLKSLSEAQK